MVEVAEGCGRGRQCQRASEQLPRFFLLMASKLVTACARVSVRLAAARVSVLCACRVRACTQGSTSLGRGVTSSSIGSLAGDASARRLPLVRARCPGRGDPARSLSPTTRYSLQLTPPERDHVARRGVVRAGGRVPCGCVVRVLAFRGSNVVFVLDRCSARSQEEMADFFLWCVNWRTKVLPLGNN